MPDRCEHCERDICQPVDVQELIDFAFVGEKAAHERTNAKLAAAMDEITLVNDLLAAEKAKHAATILGFFELLRDADQQQLDTEAARDQALAERDELDVANCRNVKAHMKEWKRAEAMKRERDRLREALRDLKGRWEQVQEAWDDEDRVAYSTAAEAVMVAESYLYAAVKDVCAALATIPAEHVEPT